MKTFKLFASGISILTATILAVTIFSSCKDRDNASSAKENQESLEDIVQSPMESIDPSFILRTNCYLCHNPGTPSHENILGPPLVASKFRYFKEYSKREDFIEGMSSFILNPRAEHALMQNPVKKLGVMPNTILSEEQVTAVVNYIYDNEIPEPSWFADHFYEEHKEPWLGQQNFEKMTLKINE